MPLGNFTRKFRISAAMYCLGSLAVTAYLTFVLIDQIHKGNLFWIIALPVGVFCGLCLNLLFFLAAIGWQRKGLQAKDSSETAESDSTTEAPRADPRAKRLLVLTYAGLLLSLATLALRSSRDSATAALALLLLACVWTFCFLRWRKHERVKIPSLREAYTTWPRRLLRRSNDSLAIPSMEELLYIVTALLYPAVPVLLVPETGRVVGTSLLLSSLLLTIAVFPAVLYLASPQNEN
ncbi:hypothetical protein SAMN04487820_10216 [Actinopolyspora mzabensis]|uniref:Uncharacterized protein n=1 Tax=Actinopolyspora mzabensis TaxID=995066 RepID=A0A1G8WG62_ACTMZ|nr:hypothetical protein [Actinopolyspora mzabensis]SDJ77166.1 hypothetical protein SAMN04487820_10216 [Actinopolyspora mzabensis]